MSLVLAGAPPLDADSREWLRALRADDATRDEAVARLHTLLLRAARFEAARRGAGLPHLRDEVEEIAHEAAGDALIGVLARLDDFRGDSRFTTWAYKFALLETAAKLRKRAWQGREVPLEPDAWNLFESFGLTPAERVEQSLLDPLSGRKPEALEQVPGIRLERHLAALPGALAKLGCRLEQRELVGPGREAAVAAKVVEAGENADQSVACGLVRDLLDLVT